MHDQPPGVPFCWVTFDARPWLPAGWQKDMIDAARALARDHDIYPTSATSRELPGDADRRFPVHIMSGDVVAAELPWLDQLYREDFRAWISDAAGEPVIVSADPHRAVQVIRQDPGEDGQEAHIDSCGVQANLYATTHPAGSGGALRVSNHGDVIGRAAVMASMAEYYPHAGDLVVLTTTHSRTHYTSRLEGGARRTRLEGSTRVIGAMTYYTRLHPESARDPGLDGHLGLIP